MVARAGHAQRAGAHGRGDLDRGVARASRGGCDEHGFAGLQSPPVGQAFMGGPAADHQPGRLRETRPAGHGGQAVRRRQRQFGEPATCREQARVHPLARLNAGPVSGRLHGTGDFLAGDERQGEPGEATAEEPDVPRADTRGVDPDQHLSRPGSRVRPFSQRHAVDPAQLLRQRDSHGPDLLTWCSCCLQDAFRRQP